MIIINNKSITQETFKNLLEMYKRQGIKVTNKVVDDKFISYVAEGFQYIYTKDIKTFPVDLIYPYVPSGNKEYLKEHICDNSQSQLKESVELIAKDYIKCHGKNPAGIGTWIFGIGSKKSSDWVEFKGKFSEAKKQAIKQAEEKSVSKIYVMESLSNENIDLHYDIKLNDKGYRVAIIKENNEIAVTQAITLSGAKSIAKKMIHNILIDTVPRKSEFNIKEFKESVNKFKSNRIEKHTNISIQNPSNTKMNRWIQEARDYQDNQVWYHGSPSGKFIGAYNGLHVGTKLAATQALEARIGVPAEGEWDGTREYGKTLLAGRDSLTRFEKQRGIYVSSGFNCCSDNLPNEDYYPTNRTDRAQYSDGTPIKFSDKPKIFKVKINVPMSNTPQNPMQDFKANGYMQSNIKKGTAKRGYYYKNEAEDAGSISAVLPNLNSVTVINESVNEDLVQKTEQSIRTPFKVIKVDSYYMIKDNLGQYLHGEYTKEDADNLVKQLNAIGNVQFSINESVDDPNIGRKWMNRYGDEIEIEFMKDGKYYTTKNGRPGGGEIIPAEQLERTIKVDTSWYNKKIETDKAIADQEAADLATKLAKDTEYSGIKGSSKLDTGRKIKALDKKLRLNSGEILTVKQIIDREIQNGAKLEVHNFWNDRLGKSVPETVLMSPDDTYRDQKNIGKIGLEYARQVLNQTNESVNVIEKDTTSSIEKTQEEPTTEPYTEEEGSTFESNGNFYDMNTILELADSVEEVEDFDVATLEWVLDYDKVRLDDLKAAEERVSKADKSVPILIYLDHAQPENEEWVVVDGIHRLTKAIMDGDKTIPAKIVTDEIMDQAFISQEDDTVTEAKTYTQRSPYKAVKVKDVNGNTYYKVQDKSLNFLSAELSKEDVAILVKTLNAVSEIQINEATKSFEVKYRSTSDSSKTEGSKVIAAPDQNVARKRFTEDNPELKNLQIISITEVTDKI